ncbi:SWIM zinc finger family protein [Halobaculum rarum]|uniref:SWIM zinc finger family protein n=1 Tax=Halobaculum rarum TaxID=3075122 RepID=UPI0032AFE3C8
MTEHNSAVDKSVVNELDFGARTVKRVTWEAFEFTIVGPHQIEVTNASYGFEKDDHTYTVGVEEREGRAVPAECSCPADIHREPDCKHKVAVAAIGTSVVLQAALDYPTPTVDAGETTSQTLKEQLRADGGTITDESPSLYESEPDECDCDDLHHNFPCWPCVRDGKRELPDR